MNNPENKYASAGEINVYKATKDVTLIDPIKNITRRRKVHYNERGRDSEVPI